MEFAKPIINFDIPRVVSVSGGRSSAMMLMEMYKEKLLNPSRGDVAIFTNTSAEHIETYKFIFKLMDAVKIPFFILEFCTFHRKAKRVGGYIIDNSYLVREPYLSIDPADNGVRWRGEVYEELLSWKRAVPCYYQRLCTQLLKIKPTRQFLLDYWTYGRDSLTQAPKLGDENSDLCAETLVAKYEKRTKCLMDRTEYLNKLSYVLSRPKVRPALDYLKLGSGLMSPWTEEWLTSKKEGDKLGRGEVEFIDYLGLRYDEHDRSCKVSQAYNSDVEKKGYEGEWVDCPLFHWEITKQAVNDYWKAQDFDLGLDPDKPMSNCTFCFLKGTKKLELVHKELNKDNKYPGTPMDIRWWVEMEQKYGMLYTKTNRGKDNSERLIPMSDYRLGFFGVSNDLSYKHIAEGLGAVEATTDDCRCTD